uniref:AIG1-type G domain-containing protein n=1 Tax=Oryza punctata TaxID=4537 RepID=A0A0E0JIB2_ORYPU
MAQLLVTDVPVVDAIMDIENYAPNMVCVESEKAKYEELNVLSVLEAKITMLEEGKHTNDGEGNEFHQGKLEDSTGNSITVGSIEVSDPDLSSIQTIQCEESDKLKLMRAYVESDCMTIVEAKMQKEQSSPDDVEVEVVGLQDRSDLKLEVAVLGLEEQNITCSLVEKFQDKTNFVANEYHERGLDHVELVIPNNDMEHDAFYVVEPSVSLLDDESTNFVEDDKLACAQLESSLKNVSLETTETKKLSEEEKETGIGQVNELSENKVESLVQEEANKNEIELVEPDIKSNVDLKAIRVVKSEESDVMKLCKEDCNSDCLAMEEVDMIKAASRVNNNGVSVVILEGKDDNKNVLEDHGKIEDKSYIVPQKYFEPKKYSIEFEKLNDEAEEEEQKEILVLQDKSKMTQDEKDQNNFEKIDLNGGEDELHVKDKNLVTSEVAGNELKVMELVVVSDIESGSTEAILCVESDKVKLTRDDLESDCSAVHADKVQRDVSLGKNFEESSANLEVVDDDKNHIADWGMKEGNIISLQVETMEEKTNFMPEKFNEPKKVYIGCEKLNDEGEEQEENDKINTLKDEKDHNTFEHTFLIRGEVELLKKGENLETLEAEGSVLEVIDSVSVSYVDFRSIETLQCEASDRVKLTKDFSESDCMIVQANVHNERSTPTNSDVKEVDLQDDETVYIGELKVAKLENENETNTEEDDKMVLLEVESPTKNDDKTILVEVESPVQNVSLETLGTEENILSEDEKEMEVGHANESSEDVVGLLEKEDANKNELVEADSDTKSNADRQVIQILRSEHMDQAEFGTNDSKSDCLAMNADKLQRDVSLRKNVEESSESLDDANDEKNNMVDCGMKKGNTMSLEVETMEEKTNFMPEKYSVPGMDYTGFEKLNDEGDEEKNGKNNILKDEKDHNTFEHTDSIGGELELPEKDENLVTLEAEGKVLEVMDIVLMSDAELRIMDSPQCEDSDVIKSMGDYSESECVILEANVHNEPSTPTDVEVDAADLQDEAFYIGEPKLEDKNETNTKENDKMVVAEVESPVENVSMESTETEENFLLEDEKKMEVGHADESSENKVGFLVEEDANEIELEEANSDIKSNADKKAIQIIQLEHMDETELGIVEENEHAVMDSVLVRYDELSTIETLQCKERDGAKLTEDYLESGCVIVQVNVQDEPSTLTDVEVEEVDLQDESLYIGEPKAAKLEDKKETNTEENGKMVVVEVQSLVKNLSLKTKENITLEDEKKMEVGNVNKSIGNEVEFLVKEDANKTELVQSNSDIKNNVDQKATQNLQCVNMDEAEFVIYHFKSDCLPVHADKVQRDASLTKKIEESVASLEGANDEKKDMADCGMKDGNKLETIEEKTNFMPENSIVPRKDYIGFEKLNDEVDQEEEKDKNNTRKDEKAHNTFEHTDSIGGEVELLVKDENLVTVEAEGNVLEVMDTVSVTNVELCLMDPPQCEESDAVKSTGDYSESDCVILEVNVYNEASTTTDVDVEATDLQDETFYVRESSVAKFEDDNEPKIKENDKMDVVEVVSPVENVSLEPLENEENIMSKDEKEMEVGHVDESGEDVVRFLVKEDANKIELEEANSDIKSNSDEKIIQIIQCEHMNETELDIANESAHEVMDSVLLSDAELSSIETLQCQESDGAKLTGDYLESDCMILQVNVQDETSTPTDFEVEEIDLQEEMLYIGEPKAAKLEDEKETNTEENDKMAVVEVESPIKNLSLETRENITLEDEKEMELGNIDKSSGNVVEFLVKENDSKTELSQADSDRKKNTDQKVIQNLQFVNMDEAESVLDYSKSDCLAVHADMVQRDASLTKNIVESATSLEGADDEKNDIADCGMKEGNTMSLEVETMEEKTRFMPEKSSVPGKDYNGFEKLNDEGEEEEENDKNNKLSCEKDHNTFEHMDSIGGEMELLVKDEKVTLEEEGSVFGVMDAVSVSDVELRSMDGPQCEGSDAVKSMGDYSKSDGVILDANVHNEASTPKDVEVEVADLQNETFYIGESKAAKFEDDIELNTEENDKMDVVGVESPVENVSLESLETEENIMSNDEKEMEVGHVDESSENMVRFLVKEGVNKIELEEADTDIKSDADEKTIQIIQCEHMDEKELGIVEESALEVMDTVLVSDAELSSFETLQCQESDGAKSTGDYLESDCMNVQVNVQDETSTPIDVKVEEVDLQDDTLYIGVPKAAKLEDEKETNTEENDKMVVPKVESPVKNLSLETRENITLEDENEMELVNIDKSSGNVGEFLVKENDNKTELSQADSDIKNNADQKTIQNLQCINMDEAEFVIDDSKSDCLAVHADMVQRDASLTKNIEESAASLEGADDERNDMADCGMKEVTTISFEVETMEEKISFMPEKYSVSGKVYNGFEKLNDKGEEEEATDTNNTLIGEKDHNTFQHIDSIEGEVELLLKDENLVTLEEEGSVLEVMDTVSVCDVELRSIYGRQCEGSDAVKSTGDYSRSDYVILDANVHIEVSTPKDVEVEATDLQDETLYIGQPKVAKFEDDNEPNIVENYKMDVEVESPGKNVCLESTKTTENITTEDEEEIQLGYIVESSGSNIGFLEKEDTNKTEFEEADSDVKGNDDKNPIKILQWEHMVEAELSIDVGSTHEVMDLVLASNAELSSIETLQCEESDETKSMGNYLENDCVIVQANVQDESSTPTDVEVVEVDPHDEMIYIGEPKVAKLEDEKESSTKENDKMVVVEVKSPVKHLNLEFSENITLEDEKDMEVGNVDKSSGNEVEFLVKKDANRSKLAQANSVIKNNADQKDFVNVDSKSDCLAMHLDKVQRDASLTKNIEESGASLDGVDDEKNDMADCGMKEGNTMSLLVETVEEKTHFMHAKSSVPEKDYAGFETSNDEGEDQEKNNKINPLKDEKDKNTLEHRNSIRGEVEWLVKDENLVTLEAGGSVPDVMDAVSVRDDKLRSIETLKCEEIDGVKLTSDYLESDCMQVEATMHKEASTLADVEVDTVDLQHDKFYVRESIATKLEDRNETNIDENYKMVFIEEIPVENVSLKTIETGENVMSEYEEKNQVGHVEPSGNEARFLEREDANQIEFNKAESDIKSNVDQKDIQILHYEHVDEKTNFMSEKSSELEKNYTRFKKLNDEVEEEEKNNKSNIIKEKEDRFTFEHIEGSAHEVMESVSVSHVDLSSIGTLQCEQSDGVKLTGDYLESGCMIVETNVHNELSTPKDVEVEAVDQQDETFYIGEPEAAKLKDHNENKTEEEDNIVLSEVGPPVKNDDKTVLTEVESSMKNVSLETLKTKENMMSKDQKEKNTSEHTDLIHAEVELLVIEAEGSALDVIESVPVSDVELKSTEILQCEDSDGVKSIGDYPKSDCLVVKANVHIEPSIPSDVDVDAVDLQDDTFYVAEPRYAKLIGENKSKTTEDDMMVLAKVESLVKNVSLETLETEKCILSEDEEEMEVELRGKEIGFLVKEEVNKIELEEADSDVRSNAEQKANRILECKHMDEAKFGIEDLNSDCLIMHEDKLQRDASLGMNLEGSVVSLERIDDDKNDKADWGMKEGNTISLQVETKKLKDEAEEQEEDGKRNTLEDHKEKNTFEYTDSIGGEVNLLMMDENLVILEAERSVLEAVESISVSETEIISIETLEYEQSDGVKLVRDCSESDWLIIETNVHNGPSTPMDVEVEAVDLEDEMLHIGEPRVAKSKDDNETIIEQDDKLVLVDVESSVKNVTLETLETETNIILEDEEEMEIGHVVDSCENEVVFLVKEGANKIEFEEAIQIVQHVEEKTNFVPEKSSVPENIFIEFEKLNDEVEEHVENEKKNILKIKKDRNTFEHTNKIGGEIELLVKDENLLTMEDERNELEGTESVVVSDPELNSIETIQSKESDGVKLIRNYLESDCMIVEANVHKESSTPRDVEVEAIDLQDDTFYIREPTTTKLEDENENNTENISVVMPNKLQKDMKLTLGKKVVSEISQKPINKDVMLSSEQAVGGDKKIELDANIKENIVSNDIEMVTRNCEICDNCADTMEEYTNGSSHNSPTHVMDSSNTLIYIIKKPITGDEEGVDSSILVIDLQPVASGSHGGNMPPKHFRNSEFISSSHTCISCYSDSKVEYNFTDMTVTKKDKKLDQKLQLIREKFLNLLSRMGANTMDFNIDHHQHKASQQDHENQEDLSFSCNILVLGKIGVGKSTVINSIMGEEKNKIDAFDGATTDVRLVSTVVDGIKVKIIDTPGLRTNVMEQGWNKKILSTVNSYIKKCPPDIILYVDRLDSWSNHFDDIPLLKTITTTLGTSIWINTIVTFTHADSIPPDNSNSDPMTYETFIAQRSHIVQKSIQQATGDMCLINAFSFVENYPYCQRNCQGKKVLPTVQNWRKYLLILCYSTKPLMKAQFNKLMKDKKNDACAYQVNLIQGIQFNDGTQAHCLAYNIRNAWKKLAYCLWGETTTKDTKHKTVGGLSVLFLGDTMLTGVKIEDCISVGESLALLSQYLLRRHSKLALHIGLNTLSTGEINLKMSTSKMVQIALLGLLPLATSMYKSFVHSVEHN